MNKPTSFLEITTVSRCVMNCNICPQELFQERYHGCSSLSLENFKRALSKVPKNVEIGFSGFAEPFLNPDCINMIEYAHSKGYKIQLYTTLVGLKTEDVERLSRCNLKLVLHLPDNLGNAKIPITETYKNTLSAVLRLMSVYAFVAMNERLYVDPRAGLIKNIPVRKVRGSFYCAKLVVPQFVMLPNCDVVLCCMDFGLKHNLGNLLSQTYGEIVNSSEFRRMQAGRFNMDDSSICRKCTQAVPLNEEYAKRLAGIVYHVIDRILGIGYVPRNT